LRNKKLKKFLNRL